MKKLICTMTLAALLCGAAGAANAPYSVTAELSPNVPVRIDGIVQTFYNVQGEEVHPISYAGTTYVPIRAIGEIMGKNVNWDNTTNTATIAGERTHRRDKRHAGYHCDRAEDHRPDASGLHHHH